MKRTRCLICNSKARLVRKGKTYRIWHCLSGKCMDWKEQITKAHITKGIELAMEG